MKLGGALSMRKMFFYGQVHEWKEILHSKDRHLIEIRS
jgi:hypothetical protein